MYEVFFQFAKYVQYFFYPFNMAIFSLVLALWFLHKGRYRRAKITVAGSLLLFYVPGMPVFNTMLYRNLESAHPSHPVREYPEADVIVVLGGATQPTLPPRYEAVAFGGRLIQAARLFQQGKAPMILLTGNGVDEYRGPNDKLRSEIDDMCEVLEVMGVPASALILEAGSRNTYENAQNSAKILLERDLDSVLLVTSAFHMRRAYDLFAKRLEGRGVLVTAVPTDHSVYESTADWTHLLPNPLALGRSAWAIKEYGGYLVYDLLKQL